MTQQSSKLEFLTLQFQFPGILYRIIDIIKINLFTNVQIGNSRTRFFSFMQLHNYILTYQRINISTYRRINIFNYKHIDIGSHLHINILTYKQIQTSTFQYMNTFAKH